MVQPLPISVEDTRKMNELLYNYSPLLVLNLYTQTTCFFRVINQILRGKNDDFIDKYRHIIFDLIKCLSHNSLSKTDQGLLTVYRGQQMSIFEAAQLQNHIGELVSTRPFLSTTLNQDVAKIFAGSSFNEKPYEVSVIFEISIDTGQSIRPYTLIRNSAEEEEEVLFSPDTKFVLISCRKLHENGVLWYFKLNAVPEQQEQQSKQSNGETFSTSNEVNETWDVRSVVIVRHQVT